MEKWYLINSSTRPNMMSGFEDEPFIDYREDAFMESLQTELASNIVLYNYDLSIGKKMRCIIQDNTANTQLKSIERTILFPIGTVKAGMYVYFENCYWLITGFPGNNKIYEKVTVILCQYKLRWQNERGQIIERWCNTTSASKYDTGEYRNHPIVLTSDNLTLLLPGDDESLDLDMKRVFIDKRSVNPTKIYKITRTDGTLYDYGEHGSVLAFIASKSEYNPDADNQELRICDYKEVISVENDENENPNLSLKIVYKGTNCIISGGNAKIFSLQILDEYNNSILSNEISWSVVTLPEHEDLITYEILQDGSIKIKAPYNEDLIGNQFLLVANYLNNSSSIYVDIGGGI